MYIIHKQLVGYTTMCYIYRMIDFDKLITPIHEILGQIIEDTNYFIGGNKYGYFDKWGFAGEYSGKIETDKKVYMVVITYENDPIFIIYYLVDKSEVSIEEYNIIRERAFHMLLRWIGRIGLMGIKQRIDSGEYMKPYKILIKKSDDDDTGKK